MGGTPRRFLATLLLPEKGTTPDLARDILAQIREASRALRVTLAGGHAEITPGHRLAMPSCSPRSSSSFGLKAIAQGECQLERRVDVEIDDLSPGTVLKGQLLTKRGSCGQ